jgi:acyl-CoA dehydrogenase
VAISLRANKVSGGYCITGSKKFISNAGVAQVYVVFASTDLNAKGKGISALVVEADSNGFKVTEKTRLLSPHPIGVLQFKECFVPQNKLLGREGNG